MSVTDKNTTRQSNDFASADETRHGLIDDVSRSEMHDISSCKEFSGGQCKDEFADIGAVHFSPSLSVRKLAIFLTTKIGAKKFSAPRQTEALHWWAIQRFLSDKTVHDKVGM